MAWFNGLQEDKWIPKDAVFVEIEQMQKQEEGRIDAICVEQVDESSVQDLLKTEKISSRQESELNAPLMLRKEQTNLTRKSLRRTNTQIVSPSFNKRNMLRFNL